MGDRAMAEIKTEGGSLYVYTHWSGHELADDAKQAVKSAEGRWGDMPYANRIIVDQLTKNSRDEETGHGLMLRPDAEDSYSADNPSVVIDLLAQEVTITGHGKDGTTKFADL